MHNFVRQSGIGQIEIVAIFVIIIIIIIIIIMEYVPCGSKRQHK